MKTEQYQTREKKIVKKFTLIDGIGEILNNGDGVNLVKAISLLFSDFMIILSTFG